MAKNTFLDWDTTASNNQDVGGITILGTSAVNNFDDALRTIMAQLRSGVDGGVAYATKSAGYTALATDNNAFHLYTATATVALTAAATLGPGWHYTVMARGGNVTIDPNGSESINNATTLVVEDGCFATIYGTGTAFFATVAQLPVLLTTDNEVPRFDGTRGKLQAGSGMSIDDSGNVSITGKFKAGNAAFVTDAQIEATITSGTVAGFEYAGASSGACIGVNRTSSDGNHLIVYRGGTQIGSISNSGSTTAFNTTSDYRVKYDVEDYDGGLAKIMELRPRVFSMLNDLEGVRRTGFIAHEVQEVFWEAVTGEKDAVEEDGSIVLQQLDAAKLVPLLVSAVQELSAEISKLKSRLP